MTTNPSPNPSQVAAASLAEVYRANLPDGTPVAVKVQRPGLERKVALDFYVMLTLALTTDPDPHPNPNPN